MKRLSPFVFTLFFAASFTPIATQAQWGFDEPEPLLYVDFRAEVGIMNATNPDSDRFALLRPTFFGFHVEAGHYFENFGVFSGLGFSYMPFRQKQSRPLGVIPTERITSSASYGSIQIPLGIAYKLGRSFTVQTAFNMNFMNMLNTQHDFPNDAIPPGFSASYQQRDEVPNWQFVPELSFGLDYDIGTRLRFLFFGAASLGTVKGVSWDYSVAEDGELATDFNVDFNYRWWRFGVGLTYHIVN